MDLHLLEKCEKTKYNCLYCRQQVEIKKINPRIKKQISKSEQEYEKMK